MSAVEVHIDTLTSCSPDTSGWSERMEVNADFEFCSTVLYPYFSFTGLEALRESRDQWYSIRLFLIQAIKVLKVASYLL